LVPTIAYWQGLLDKGYDALDPSVCRPVRSFVNKVSMSRNGDATNRRLSDSPRLKLGDTCNTASDLDTALSVLCHQERDYIRQRLSTLGHIDELERRIAALTSMSSKLARLICFSDTAEALSALQNDLWEAKHQIPAPLAPREGRAGMGASGRPDERSGGKSMRFAPHVCERDKELDTIAMYLHKSRLDTAKVDDLFSVAVSRRRGSVYSAA
jgi:hypothetical protein